MGQWQAKTHTEQLDMKLKLTRAWANSSAPADDDWGQCSAQPCEPMCPGARETRQEEQAGESEETTAKAGGEERREK